MNYNQMIIYCTKYNINMYNDNGKHITYNKLDNKINEHTNKKT